MAFSAAVVIALFADFAPVTTSLTPIMKASWMGLDCGDKSIELYKEAIDEAGYTVVGIASA